MGLTLPGVGGPDPYEAELWCVPADYTFTVAADLSSAALDIPTCDAQVVAYDPETGEETPTGATVTISASTQWAATGPLEQQQSLGVPRRHHLDHGHVRDVAASRHG